MQSKFLPRVKYRAEKSIYRLAQADLTQQHCKMVTVPLSPNVSSSFAIALPLTRSPRRQPASLLVPRTLVNTRLWLVAGCCSGGAAVGYED